MSQSRRLAVGSAVLASAGGIAVCAIMRKSFIPRIKAKPTKWNEAILKLCPHLSAEYHLPAILNNGHVETIFAALFRRNPHITYEREILHMPDGGVIALDAEISSTGVSGPQTLDDTAPVLILLPGLTGGSGDTYVQHAVIHARKAGIRAIVFNSRGTSKSPIVTPQFYSASFTQDMRCVVAHLASKYPKSRLFAAGWSLGANILTRYLGEEGEDTPIQAAVVMCNPFDLPYCDKNFKRGFNRIYDWNLAKSLRKIYQEHHSLFVNAANSGIKSYDPEKALRAKTIRDFDDAITRISFGWDSVDNYYAGSSSSLSIPNVKVPCLVIQAEDDPIAPKQAIPFKALDDNPNCILVTTPTGGHLGWCSGENGILGAPWTDMALNQYFSAVNNLLDDDHAPRMFMSERPGVWLVSTQQETV